MIKVEDEPEGVTTVTVIIWNMVDMVVGRSASPKEPRATGAGQVSRLDVGLHRAHFSPLSRYLYNAV